MASSPETKSPARTPDEVRAEIERARSDVATSVSALKQEMAVRTDWREWVRRNPLLCISGALMAGWILGQRR